MEYRIIRKDDSELYHWGIKGQKWGRRRYQNRDGSLTPAGEKRYNKEMEKLQKEERRLANERATKDKIDKLESARKRVEEQKAELKKKPEDKNTDTKKKSVSEMTDAEVAAYKQRIQNERDIIKFQNEISSMTPQEKTKIEKFADGIGGKVVKTVWDDVAKKQINDFLSKNLKVEEPLDEIGKLKKEASKWKEKASIAKNKKDYGDNTEKHENAERRRAREKIEREEAEKKEKERLKAQEAKKQRDMDAYEEFQRKERESRENPPKKDPDYTYRMKGDDIKDRVWETNKPDKKPQQLLLPGPVKKGEDFVDTLFNSIANETYRDLRKDGTNYYRSPNKNKKSYLDSSEAWIMDMTRNGVFNSRWVDYDDIEHSAITSDFLIHYGILGMKWGIRRFQNKDGTRTAAGKKRESEVRKAEREEVKMDFGDVSKTGIFKEALSNFRLKRNSSGYYEPLEVETTIGKNKDVTVSIDVADYKNKIYADIPERAKRTDEFVKKFDDDGMRKYLVDEYYEYSDKSMTREEFGKQFTLYHIRTDTETDMFEASYYDDGCMYGHSFDIEGNMKDRKPYLSSMNG